MTPGLFGRALIIGMIAASLGACSRPSEPAASAPAAHALIELPAEPVVATAAPSEEPTSLTPAQVARLVRPHSPVFGPRNAPVTVVEVLDPACEACKAFSPVVEQLLFTYPEDVRVVVRYADFHPVSLQALRLLVAASAQNKVHEVLSALFERQQEWASHGSPDPARAWKIAGDAGLNIAKAQKDALAENVDHILQQEADDLVALQVLRTPTFFVNGKPLTNFGPQELVDLVKSEVQAAKSKP